MATRASKWPNSCDFRPAWWGVGANLYQNPIPQKIEGWLRFWSNIDPDWPTPSWFPTFPTGSPPWEAWEVYQPDCVGSQFGYEPIVWTARKWSIKARDEWFDHPDDGPGWYRLLYGRLDNPGSGDFIIFDDAVPHPTQPGELSPWTRGPFDMWGTGLANFATFALPATWSVEGWPDPPAVDPLVAPGVLGLNLIYGRPTDWEPEFP